MEELAKRFREITEKYKMDEKKATAIAEYVTHHDKKQFSIEDFSKEFEMEEEDAKIFLKFIYAGIEFREKHLI